MSPRVMMCALLAAGLLLGANAEARRGKPWGKRAGSSYSYRSSGLPGGGTVVVRRVMKPRSGCLRVLSPDDQLGQPVAWTCPKVSDKP